MPVAALRVGSTGWAGNIVQLCSAVIPVVAGDYFEMYMNVNNTTAAFRTVAAFETTFAIEVVEADA